MIKEYSYMLLPEVSKALFSNLQHKLTAEIFLTGQMKQLIKFMLSAQILGQRYD